MLNKNSIERYRLFHSIKTGDTLIYENTKYYKGILQLERVTVESIEIHSDESVSVKVKGVAVPIPASCFCVPNKYDKPKSVRGRPYKPKITKEVTI